MLTWKIARRSASMVAAILLLATLIGLSISRAGAQQSAVTTYHGSPMRTGSFVTPGLTCEKARSLHLDPSFDAHFAGHVYAQPLFWQPPGSALGILIVATEDDTVLALDAKTGRTVWDKTLRAPVSRDALPCGNIDPLGITGTPVIDPQSQVLYVDAAVSGPSGPRHQVFALSLRNGSTMAGWPVDVADALKAAGLRFDPPDQNERGALTVLGDRVYVPFGGHFGDCGSYHGWVVGISISNPKDVKAWHTRAAGGGIWAPGGISSDGKSLYLATGNNMDTAQWEDGEAIIRLAPDLGRSERKADYFTPSNWHELDERDADLGGSNPLLFDIGTGSARRARVLALGKDGRAYLLDRDNLGGIGGELVARTVSMGRIITGPAAYSVAGGTFVAFGGEGADCPGGRVGGLTVLKIGVGQQPRISTAWCGVMRGRGSPIVTTTDGHSDPIVWIVGAEGDDRLHGFRGDKGEQLFTSGQIEGLRHFQTLIATNGRLYVAGDGRVYAFAFPAP
jgi:outer membrane protein assembly factor BamB